MIRLRQCLGGLALALFAFTAVPAQAQQVNLYCFVTGSTGLNAWQPCSSGNPLSVKLVAGAALIGTVAVDQTTPGTTNNITVSPLPRAARNFPGCSVTTSSASCLTASTAVTFLQVQNVGTSNAIACAFGATAILNSAGSFQLASGQGASWGPNTGGVPTGALNCIAATGTTPLYLEWN